jgi:inner membrane protein
VDPLTHGLASYALKRAAFPRVPRPITLAILLAGSLADLDIVTTYASPSAFLTWHRTYCHSLLFALLLGLLLTFLFLLRNRRSSGNKFSLLTIFPPVLAAAVLHLLMDTCQSAGVELLWPFSTRRFALDWIAHLDLWILALLLAGIFLPMLSSLITEEIGAKSKGPRGRTGASLALATMVVYFAVRFAMHSNAIAALESRNYRSERPRRVAAFGESGSPFRWDGIVETESALHQLEVDVGPGTSFDSESTITTYKPESSPALDAARNCAVAQRLLKVARFPRASVEKTSEGFHVILRDFAYTRDANNGRSVEALIDTDATRKILSQELGWDPRSKGAWW